MTKERINLLLLLCSDECEPLDLAAVDRQVMVLRTSIVSHPSYVSVISPCEMQIHECNLACGFLYQSNSSVTSDSLLITYT